MGVQMRTATLDESLLLLGKILTSKYVHGRSLHSIVRDAVVVHGDSQNCSRQYNMNDLQSPWSLALHDVVTLPLTLDDNQ